MTYLELVVVLLLVLAVTLLLVLAAVAGAVVVLLLLAVLTALVVLVLAVLVLGIIEIVLHDSHLTDLSMSGKVFFLFIFGKIFQKEYTNVFSCGIMTQIPTTYWSKG